MGAATYGPGNKGFKENISPDNPLNAYGLTKTLVDQHINPATVGLKFFNVYGPGENHKGKMASVALHLYKEIKKTGKATLFKSHNNNYADGEQERDFVHVHDAANAVLYFLFNPQISGRYNIGTGQARTFNDLAKSVFKALQKPVNIQYTPTPEHIRQHYQYHTQADLTQLRQAGYKQKFLTLEQGTKQYIQHLEEQE